MGKMWTLILQTLGFVDDREIIVDNYLFQTVVLPEARCGLPRRQLIVHNYLLSHLTQARFLSVAFLQIDRRRIWFTEQVKFYRQKLICYTFFHRTLTLDCQARSIRRLDSIVAVKLWHYLLLRNCLIIIWRVMKTNAPPSCCHRRRTAVVPCLLCCSLHPSSGVRPFVQLPAGLVFVWKIGFQYWCHEISLFKGKMHLIRFTLWVRPTPHLQGSPRPLAVFKGPTSKVSKGECKGEVTGAERRDGRQ